MKTSTYKLVIMVVLVIGGQLLMAQDPENEIQYRSSQGTSQNPGDITRIVDPGATEVIPFAVFPNLANCLLYIRMGTDHSVQSELKIFNALWQQVYSRNVSGISDLTVDVTGYAEGTYFVRLTTEKNDIQVKKIYIVP